MSDKAEFDYIIVGSGAGGGPLAANLAKAGFSVCLIDSGTRDEPIDYKIPVFHTIATEDPELAWFTYVRHYADQKQQEKDSKYVKWSVPPTPEEEQTAKEKGYEVPIPSVKQAKDGVFYPRCGTLGGCTAHHAQIIVYPHNADWDGIAELTGDWTWNAENMRNYFVRLENCHYRPFYRFLYKVFGFNPTRHGFEGWLPTKVANLKIVFRDKQLLKLLAKSVLEAIHTITPNWLSRLLFTAKTVGDANAWRSVKRNSQGLRQTALCVDKQLHRFAARDYVEEVEKSHPDKLTVKLETLVSRVLFDDELEDGKHKAVGIEYYEGKDLYEAAGGYDPGTPLGEKKQLFAKREIILSGGAYATPQLLMLSGVGDKGYLKKAGIECRVHRPGVGKNMQDRYEVGIVSEMKEPFALLKGAEFKASPDDPLYQEWKGGGDGAYATNGAVLSIIKKSKPERPLPDLYIFGLVGPFKGYYPGYHQPVVTPPYNKFTWAILKAHTENRGGVVKLNADDPTNPRRLPDINFHYFDEGTDTDGHDLESVVEGVKFVRDLNEKASEVMKGEEYPGIEDVPTDDDEKIRTFIRDNAWGHHASCTCPIGLESDTETAVIDSKFRVFGTKNLRVVDACVFPRIPGFFIVLPIHMISEKAFDEILTDARRPLPFQPRTGK